ANHGVVGPAHARGAFGHCGEDWLKLSRRPADHPKDLAGGRLLFLRLNQFAVACLELLLRLRQELQGLGQTLLRVTDLGVLIRPRLAVTGGLGFALCWVGPPTHLSPLPPYESAGDRLGERARVGKWASTSLLVFYENVTP